jgi:hypothetical protein
LIKEMAMLQSRAARDGEEFAVRSSGGDWLIAWHSPVAVPAGKAHGANAFCVTADVDEHAPQFERYRAEEDAVWPEWAGLPIEEVLGRLKVLREEIIALVKGLTEAAASRIGIHQLFGEMSLALWLEFFLLHEAHHLYVVMTRLGQAKKSLSAEPIP